MKIGFDARMISHSGIGTYSRGILSVLTTDNAFDFTLFGNPAKIGDYLAKKVVCDYPIYSLKEQFLFPSLLNRHSFDLMHFPHYNVPLGYRKPFVVTVHDCIHLLYPKSRMHYLYAKTLMKLACTKALRVATDSNHTKQDLIRLLNVPEKKISVIYPGVAEDWREKIADAKTKDSNHGPLFSTDYALYIGNVRPLKNVELMVQAFEKASKQRKMKLLIAGKSFMPEWTAQFKNREDLVFLGEVSQITLTKLYANAKLFIFPSLYEGFGLPPLEAMASGVPVICSNAASLSEVVGGAALLFDPTDERSLTEHLLKLWDDSELRRTLIQKGYANASRFSWKTCTGQIAALYRECLS